jgi:predicted O-linked N-acetylglucosamine transferase (SPINDLY family)
MGVPVISLIGKTVVGRAGLSQLTNLGLEKLAASTEEQFVRLVADLASDFAVLQTLRVGLRERMRQSPLMDGIGWTRGIEQAYRRFWRKWCQGLEAKPGRAVG